MKTYVLQSGAAMPSLGLGTWLSDPGVVGAAVKSALELGYRHVDCASIYGNESEIGVALQETLKSQGGDTIIKREDLFVTSKLWNTEHAPADVETALRKSLCDLQLDYLDLYLVHWPVCISKEGGAVAGAKMLSLEEMPLIDTWRAMEDCVEKGLVKDIGVSNFSQKKLQELVAQARIKPAVNQMELHPYLPMKELVEYCKTENIHLTGYSPLGSNQRPAGLRNDQEKPILDDPTVADIAKKHKATPAQVCLAWALERGTSTIPKSVSAERQKENLESIHVTLDATDMEQLAALDTHTRYVDGTFWCTEGSPYTMANLWDE